MSNVHHHTPTLKVVDGRGIQVREVTYLRHESSAQPQARMTRYRQDISHQIVEQYSHSENANASSADSKQISSLTGAPLLTQSSDAGWRLTFFGEAGQALEKWDARNSHWQMSYDNLLRLTVIYEKSDASIRRAVERLSYADNSAAYAQKNQCGRLIRHDDPAGSLHFSEYDPAGNVLSETRHFLKDQSPANWPEVPARRDELLENGSGYTTTWQYAPTDEILVQEDAKGHTQRFWFDVAGQLRKVTLQLNGATEQRLIFDQADYNAQGRITSQTLGGKITSETAYRPENGRVRQRKISRSSGSTLQKLQYTYDPVGNVSSVEDTAKPEQHNANQRIKPVSTYAYDSLYQLVQASGREEQGARIHASLPEWSSGSGDRSRLLGFTQRYTYDERGNLIKLQHQREGNNYTREMRVAPGSNRALSWKTGDPEPDFAQSFDANGNLQWLQAGQPLEWNARNQLQRAALIERDDDDADAQTCCYDANGRRVRKRQIQRAHAITHVHDVIYLPGLEIRESRREKLEVISVQAGACTVRCLHWSLGLPSAMTNDAMRYSVDDHLGSNTMELDAEGNLISEEGYYPFGGTAWRAARSILEAKYRTLRYSGKERDASGLYYYGSRYYAPWLQRWISPDPAGAADGLNLYCMVGNNPVRYVDKLGNNKEEANIKEELAVYPNILSEVRDRVKILNHQISHSFSNTDIRSRLLQSYTYNFFRNASSIGAGVLAAPGGPAAAVAASVTTSLAVDAIAGKSGATRHLPVSLYPQNSRLDPDDIEHGARTSFFDLNKKTQKAVNDIDPRNETGQKKLSLVATRFIVGRVMEFPGAWVSNFESSTQATKAMNGLPAQKIERLNNSLALLDEYLEHDSNAINAAFDTLGVDEFYAHGVKGSLFRALDLATNNAGTSTAHSLRRADMQHKILKTRATIQRGRELLFRLNEYNASKGR